VALPDEPLTPPTAPAEPAALPLVADPPVIELLLAAPESPPAPESPETELPEL
jgi:hypothetical protein